jgi:hypothetical protein
MGLHPWELWEYTWEEFRAKRKGQRSREQRIYQQTRQLAYCILLPYLDKKARKKPLDEIVPDMYESVKVKPKKTYDEIMAPYIKAGVIKPNAGK